MDKIIATIRIGDTEHDLHINLKDMLGDQSERWHDTFSEETKDLVVRDYVLNYFKFSWKVEG
jgi:hypothetical protein